MAEPQIRKVSDNTWIIDEGGVRAFILAGSEKAMVIDTGMKLQNVRSIAEFLTGLPVDLINTHSDVDHIGANAEFIHFFMHPADAEGYHLKHGRMSIIEPVVEGDVIDLGGRPLQIVELPGHTPGSIGILDVNGKVLISGDPIQDGKIFMFGANRNMPLYIESLKKLWAWNGGEELLHFDTIYPSHGTLPVEPSLIPKLIGAAEEIESGALEGKVQSMFGNDILYYDFGFAGFLCDPKKHSKE